MREMNVRWLALQLAIVTLVGITSQASAITGRDEGSCIYDLVTAKIQSTNWNHLRLESQVYFTGPVSGTKTYTIFASSATTSPSDFKIQVQAIWTTTPVGSCDFAPNTVATVTSAANEAVLHWANVATSNAPTELDPSRFPRIQGFSRPAADNFFAERAYGERAPARVTQETTGLFARRADGSVNISPEGLNALYLHGPIALAEGGGLYALTRYTAPTGRAMRYLRRAGQAALALDAANRLYVVVGEGRSPSYVPLYNTTVGGATALWDSWARGSHLSGVLNLPAGYVDTFYTGNVRLTDAEVRARQTTNNGDAPARIAAINARLAEIDRIFSDASTSEQGRLRTERANLNADLNRLRNPR